MTQTFRWAFSTFDKLSVDDLYAILRLRAEVFVVEQKAIYLDLDGFDKNAAHIMGWSGDKLVAYGRILKPGAIFPEYSFNRVVTAPEFRNMGVGKKLMHVILDQMVRSYGEVPIRIAAQEHLVESFYLSYGFERTGETYEDAGVLHVQMLGRAKSL